MRGSKKLLLAIAIIFAGFLAFVVYDFSRKTTFPGHKQAVTPDSVSSGPKQRDSVRNQP